MTQHQSTIGMRICSLYIIVSFLLLQTIAVELEAEVETKTITVNNVKAGISPNPPCGAKSYTFPITFRKPGKGAVVFTMAEVPTRSVSVTRLVAKYAGSGQLEAKAFPSLKPISPLNDIHVGIGTRNPASGGDLSGTNPFIEIIFGGWGNTRSVIRASRQGKEIARVENDIDRVISGGNYWVSLDNNRVRAGTGTQINTNVLMDVNLDAAGVNVVKAGEIYPGQYVGFGCWDVPLTYTQISLVSDCEVGEFDSGTPCSASCGGGTSTKKRPVTLDVSGSEYGAAVCPALTQEVSCNLNPCPIDCVMNTWSAWGACSATCRCDGCTKPIQTRTRTARSIAAFGGSNCPTGTELRECNIQPCPVDCVPGEWSDFGECSEPCGGTGVHSRFRSVRIPATNGGVDCPSASLSDVAPCNIFPCPLDCVQTDWSDWTECSLPCGTGTQQRTRTTTTTPDYGGAVCGPTIASQECNKQPCPVNCEVSEWTAWGDCDQPCGTGSYSRKRTVTRPTAFGGLPCEPLDDVGACNTQECPVDKLAVLIKRIRHLELQDRVNTLEEQAVQQAQTAVAQTAFDLAKTAAVVSTISLSETVTHGAHSHAQAQAQAQAQVHSAAHLRTLHPALVAASHPFIQPSITQLLQSEILVDELAKFAARQQQIEQRYPKKAMPK